MPAIDSTVNGSITANAQTVALDVTRKSAATITLSGTWVGTLQFEATTNDATWVAVVAFSTPAGAQVTNAIANGTWSVTVAGYSSLRVRASAWSSGSAGVAIRASSAPVPAAHAKPYLFAPDAWDAGWVAAKLTSATAPAHVSVIGDSFAQGHSGVSDWMTKTWFALMRTRLLAQYTQGADFWGPQQSAENATASGTTFNGTPPFSAIGATNRALGSGGWGKALFFNSAGPLAWTFTTPYACTDIDLITMNYITGSPTWQYTVDGGAPVTVTNPGLTSPKSLIRTQITGLANTTHTIVASNQSTAIACLLFGVATYKSRTVGMRFGWNGVYGAATNNWLLGSQPDYGQEKIWAGKSGAANTGFGFPAQPDLAIIAVGINDCRQVGYGPEGYQAALRRICQAIRAGKPNASILFMANANPDGQVSDVTSPFTNATQWPLFIDKMLNIAIDFNAALVNFHSKWGEVGVSLGFESATDPHPTDAGHADIDATLAYIV